MDIVYYFNHSQGVILIFFSEKSLLFEGILLILRPKKTSAYRRLTCEECYYLPFRTNSSIILLASSILLAFNDERYILVVFSESCPNPSLMTEMGILLL